MKKLLRVALLAGLSVSLFACKDSSSDLDTQIPEEDKVYTNYETVMEFIDNFEIPNNDALLENIFLPQYVVSSSSQDTITWESSNIDALSSKGFVTRSDEDVEVILTATITYKATKHREYFTCTVKGEPDTPQGLIDEAAGIFEVLENDYTDADIIVLPRVTDISGGYIEWATSDPSIIDLEGNVYRKAEEQTVNLTATFNFGPNAIGDYANAKTTKTYKVTVGSTSDDSPAEITPSDSRILSKIYVEDNAELYAACANAKAGDAIILKDGTYNGLDLVMENSGTAANPILIMGENPGEVKISGSTNIEILADYVTLANLVFVDGYPKTDTGAVNFEGSNLRLTNTEIYAFDRAGYEYKWVSLTGQYHEIDRNVFDGKVTGGALLTIWREDLNAQYHHIYKNEFKNYNPITAGNGFETIRIGTSDFSQSSSYVLLEENLFENLTGEIEIVSIKSGRTIVRNNTFVECVGLLTSRHGKNNLLTGNTFLCNDVENSGGVRLYDGGHVVKNNYISGVNANSDSRAGIVIHSGVQLVGDTTTMNLQWIPYNILIENNSVVDSTGAISFCGKYTYTGVDMFFVNNLITSPTSGIARIDKVPTSIYYTNNYFFGTATASSSSTAADKDTYDFATMAGVTFSTTMPTLTTKDGVKYYTAVENIGAQNVVVITEDMVGTNFSNRG